MPGKMRSFMETDPFHISMSPYGALPSSPPPPARTSLCRCIEKCKKVAKKSFDVICLISGLAMIGFGTALVIGESVSVAPNRPAGLGLSVLGFVIAKGNYDEIRKW